MESRKDSLDKGSAFMWEVSLFRLKKENSE
jgi:hypothetical protein